MPRIYPAEKCLKCQGRQLKRVRTSLGSIYACANCDAEDPMKMAQSWLKSELQPPSQQKSK
jgi:hypothetical protein